VHWFVGATGVTTDPGRPHGTACAGVHALLVGAAVRRVGAPGRPGPRGAAAVHGRALRRVLCTSARNAWHLPRLVVDALERGGEGGVRACGDAQGYFGCAIGKGRQLARTEIEKLKLSELTCREVLKEVSRMYVGRLVWLTIFCMGTHVCVSRSTFRACSIRMVHDDVKDKPYELELSWICPEVSRWAMYGREHLSDTNR